MIIISERGHETWASWQLVYEWEDEMVKSFNGSNLYLSKDIVIKGHHVLRYLARKTGININTLFLHGKDTFRFCMSPELEGSEWNWPNLSVDIIDFYLKKEQLHNFYRCYSKVKSLYVSSREVYEFLLANNPEREVRHLPLTLPDKYRITRETNFAKKFDLVMLGRQSNVLVDYLHEYEKNHQIYYIYNTGKKGENFNYITNKGEVIPEVLNREDYINLLRKSKVILYSTAGMDSVRKTNGFHQVTPKFLEAIASGCHVISQFLDNPDTEFFELNRMSQRVKCYKDFEKAMDYALSTPVDMQQYSQYLEKHYTSTYKNLM